MLVQQLAIIGSLLALASARPLFLLESMEEGLGSIAHMGDTGVHTNTVWTFTDCGNPTDAVLIDSLTVSPDPPQPGKNLTVKASGTVKKTIDEGAYADVVVKLGLIKILTKRFDVCEELAKANATLQCPVEPGDYTITQVVELPREIPRAKFIVQTRAFTQPPESDLACADIMIDFLRPGPRPPAAA